MKNIYKFVLVIAVLFSSICLFAQENSSIKYTSEVMYNISIVGAVNNPGTYPVLGNTRVSELIKMANVTTDTLTLELKGIAEIASKRSILLKRQNSETTLDLQKFYTLGDTKQNPYLLDGDIVIVPAKAGTISISGAVHREGFYEIIKNDKITDILKLAFGLRNDAFLQKINIVRFINSCDSTKIITLNLAKIIENPDSKENLVLQNDDRIYIRSIPEYHQQNSVEIFGEVKYPGVYAIEDDVSTLLEILEQVGGVTYRADLRNSFLHRKSSEDLFDPEFERLKKMTIDEMTTLEYEYFKAKSRELNGKFSVNFENIWQGNQAAEITLKNNDYIYVSRQISTISISGSVKNPGLITFVPNQNYSYYIEQAGGFAWNARKSKIRIIKANAGEWIKPNKKTTIDAGDMIFVPEKLDLDYWEITKDIMRIAAEIATVIIVVQNITP